MMSVGVFAAADDAYVPKAVMALRSFQRQFPDWSYFLAGRRGALSAASVGMLDRYGIHVLDVDPRTRFTRARGFETRYPVEVFNTMLVPELLAAKGISHSIGIDGDVFCVRRFDHVPLLRDIEGFGARPVAMLRSALAYRRRKYAGSDAYRLDRLHQLGLTDRELDARFEVNTGVVFWNNVYMASIGLAEKAAAVFAACDGRISGDQLLLSVTAACHRLPFHELDHAYHFCFRESFRRSPGLAKEVADGDDRSICIVHFTFLKPWRPAVAPSPLNAHFINRWRSFVREELGGEAEALFDDVSAVRVRLPIGPVWNTVRRLRSTLGRMLSMPRHGPPC
jgi:hypothetical protein